MNNKILAELEFGQILSESMAQTQTGAEVINKYKSYLMANECTFGLVNSFLQEARNCLYDNGVNETFSQVAEYVSDNKTSWALATACENINSSNASYNYLNRNAAKQVQKLLEMEEQDVVKYIKAGALKNVMFCESFRNIAKQVYKDQPLVEATAEYVKAHPISLVENAGDSKLFEVAGTLYQLDEEGNIQECNWSEASNTFKTVSQLLESNLVTVTGDDITITAGKAKYIINEPNKVVKEGKEGKVEMTSEQLRENNRLMLMATNPRFRNQMAGVLEAVALTCENYDNIFTLDTASIYSTKNDKFVVIEAGDNLYATLLQSNRSSKWTINENAIEAISFIKSKTNVSLNEVYKENIDNCLETVSEQQQEEIKEALENQKILSYKERIEALTEKFKDDPVRLALISKVAAQLQEA